MSEECWRCEDAPPDLEHVDEHHHLAENGKFLECQHKDGGGGTTHYEYDYCPMCGTELKNV